MILVLLCCLYSSCTALFPELKHVVLNQPKPVAEKKPISDLSNEIETVPENAQVFYQKHFKIITSQGYIRNVQRNYYGPQQDLITFISSTKPYQGINIETCTKFPIASFFSPTAINIPPDKKEKAMSLYIPLSDTLFSVNKADLHLVIIVLGYTDETSPEINSDFYKEVLKKSQKKSFTEQDYFNYTSYFRAKEIGDMISDILDLKKDRCKKYNKLIIDLFIEGRGIEYPDSKREYLADDDKRRITKVYWKILPDLR